MGRVIATLWMAGLAGWVGCAAPPHGQRDGCTQRDKEDLRCTVCSVGPRSAPALLFDQPTTADGRAALARSYWRAEDFAARSDWPCVRGDFAPGEVTFYRERFYDHQGRNFNHSNETYRTFHSQREGMRYR